MIIIDVIQNIKYFFYWIFAYRITRLRIKKKQLDKLNEKKLFAKLYGIKCNWYLLFFFLLNRQKFFQFECCGVRSYRDWLYSSWGRDIPGRTELGIGYSDIGKVPKSCCNQDGMRDYPTDCGVSFDKVELWTYEPFLHTKVFFYKLYKFSRNFNFLDFSMVWTTLAWAWLLLSKDCIWDNS